MIPYKSAGRAPTAAIQAALRAYVGQGIPRHGTSWYYILEHCFGLRRALGKHQ